MHPPILGTFVPESLLLVFVAFLLRPDGAVFLHDLLVLMGFEPVIEAISAMVALPVTFARTSDSLVPRRRGAHVFPGPSCLCEVGE